MSDLGRLFWRRASEWQEPLENFTTEALAIAISHDFRPMKEALRQVDWSYSGQADQRSSPIDIDAIVAIDATTQEALWTANGAVGYLDLVLCLHVDGEQPREVWVEVKVNAWESGRQLEVYLEQAALRSPTPPVITLARTRISDKVPALKWAAVARAIDTTHDVHSSWAALADFLNEEHIGSPPAPTPLDTASCIEVVVEVNASVRKLWPEIAWAQDGRLRSALTKGDSQDVATMTGPLWFGLRRREHLQEWALTVTTAKNYQKVPLDPNELLHAAEIVGLPDQWCRHPESREVLQSVAPVDADVFTDRDEVVAWFHQGLRQLRDAGIMNGFMAGLLGKHGVQSAPLGDDVDPSNLD